MNSPMFGPHLSRVYVVAISSLVANTLLPRHCWRRPYTSPAPKIVHRIVSCCSFVLKLRISFNSRAQVVLDCHRSEILVSL